MTITPVQITAVDNKTARAKNQKQVAFGAMNPVITLMDAVDRGGFAASFILQDFLGMAAPRVGTGLYRNSDKTGHLNWDFAKKEGIREILSGPCAFIVPAFMLKLIKKFSGEANNVPIDFINGLGETFATYAQNNKDTLKDVPAAKQGFYKEVFKNVLKTSTDGNLAGEELETAAETFAQRLVQIGESKEKSFWKRLIGKPEANATTDLTNDLLNDFVKIKKQYLGAPKDKIIGEFTYKDKTLATKFKTLLNHMKDYSSDAINTVNKKIKTQPDVNVSEFINKLSNKRSGTRFLSNMSMILAVIGFYRLIPKLYNSATKGRDPGLDGLVNANQTNKTANKNDPSFTGLVDMNQNDNNTDKSNPSFTGLSSTVTKLGKTIGDNQGLFKKFSNIFEFEGASMSVPAMVTILFGFCLPPRLKNAQSDTDRKEILFRDLMSFSAILFGAKALTKAFSKVFSKVSGLALNIQTSADKATLPKRIWSYINPSGGINVLDNDRIIANYTDVGSFKNGITDMFKFIKKHDGNVGKVLNLDAGIKEAATEILGEVPNKNMKFEDIVAKFDAQKDSAAYKKIVDILKDKNNTLVRKAKTYNSAFGFASTILLVPALMMWISKHCENMTKQRMEQQAKENARLQDELSRKFTNTPSMQGFLKG